MNIAIYAYRVQPKVVDYIYECLNREELQEVNVSIESKVMSALLERYPDMEQYSRFSSKEDLKQTNLMFSFGGDGTILAAVACVQELEIPILGINMGRLGFLANFSQELFENKLEKILKGDYQLSNRTLISVSSPNIDIPFNFAMNEVSINRKETTSMINVEANLNGEYLNNYWADGLIVATPTGSTGYSLSCGGPIIQPNTNNFVITPIATHNLNVRPFIINDQDEIQIHVSSRESQFLLSLDSRIISVDIHTPLTIKKAKFKAKLVQLESQTYLTTLRQKLYWGKDKRN